MKFIQDKDTHKYHTCDKCHYNKDMLGTYQCPDCEAKGEKLEIDQHVKAPVFDQKAIIKSIEEFKKYAYRDPIGIDVAKGKSPDKAEQIKQRIVKEFEKRLEIRIVDDPTSLQKNYGARIVLQGQQFACEKKYHDDAHINHITEHITHMLFDVPF